MPSHVNKPREHELVIPAAAAFADRVVDTYSGKGFKLISRIVEENVGRDDTRELLSQLSVGGANGLIRSVSNSLLRDSITSADVESALERLGRKPGSLREFSLRFAEGLVQRGEILPQRLHEETQKFLAGVSRQVVALRTPMDVAAGRGREQLLEELRNLDRQLVAFATNNDFIRAHDYVALNAQHTSIARAVKRLEGEVFDGLTDSIKAALLKGGLLLESDLKKGASTTLQALRKLSSLGILHVDEIPEIGRVYVYASAETDCESFERIVSPRVRETIGDNLLIEFSTKYSGKLRPIGISENRSCGVPTLLDRKRVAQVATNSGVSVSLVVLALKYLESHGLVRVEHTGYVPTQLGNSAGLGFRSVRFVQRRSDSGLKEGGLLSFDQYLDAARDTRDKWKLPSYTLNTDTGGAPWVYLLDELLIGNARVDSELVRHVVDGLQSDKQSLVVASNTIQGDPAVFPRALRTSVAPTAQQAVDMREYGEQVRLVQSFLCALDRPVLQLHGRREHETAELKADTQRIRDMEALKGLVRSDESKVKAALSRLNDIEARAGRKYNAVVHTEVLEFVSNIVMPLESKLGRQLLDAQQVRLKIGLNLNELEIVRDMAALLLQDRKSATEVGERKLQVLYRDFLALPEIGPDYLALVKEALFPAREVLAPGKIVARGGARVNFTTREGKAGLSMLCLPEAKFGVGEVMHPTAKLMSVIKSNILAGSKMPDVVCVASTGQPIVSMTAGGQLIVSADTLQSSSFESSFLYSEAPDSHKRRRWNRGGDNFGGCIAFSGGVDDGIKTDAYSVRLWNKKIREVLEHNEARRQPPTVTDIFATSDWQTGSPTSRPSTWLRGLFWAVLSGQKEIVINGDLIQGQNYGRAVAEMQLTGLVGIEDQQAFIHALLNPVLDLIKQQRSLDPAWQIPRFTILTGNHETNSQAGRGAQGTWFLQTVAGQIEAYYRGAFGPAEADAKVVYPKKFVDRMGVDVDYSHVVLDFSESNGFRIAAQHYVGAGVKGSSSVPPIAAAAQWGRSMENELRPVHGFLFGHWHTQSITQADGVFYAIFGASADKSGFEWHLGYPTTVPAAGRVRLFSDKPPELLFVTDPYLRVQEEALLARNPVYSGILSTYGSLENFVEHERARHQKRNQKAFSYEELSQAGRHSFLDPHRRIGEAG